MERISFSSILPMYKTFDKAFWLDYKTLEKLLPQEKFNEIKMSLLKSKRVSDKYFEGIDRDQFEVEKKLLDAEWTQKNEESKQQGIQIHEQIHNLFCTDIACVKRNLGIDTETYQISAQENFLNTDKGIFNELKLEVPLDEEVILVGIIDCLIKDGNHLTLIDWKSNDQIKWKSIYEVGKKHTKRLKYPLSAFDDCSGIHYQIQLSLYAWMCQQLNPDFIIDTLRIVQVKDLKKYKSWDVEYLKNDIDKLLKWHLKNMKIKKETDKCKPIIY